MPMKRELLSLSVCAVELNMDIEKETFVLCSELENPTHYQRHSECGRIKMRARKEIYSILKVYNT